MTDTSTCIPTPSTLHEPWLSEQRHQLEHHLTKHLPHSSQRLHHAMRYSTLGAGKRVRALLMLATQASLAPQAPLTWEPACSLEFMHSYSLIHDDLPCMDDDDLRRGKPSCHKQFDQATAILAGDALQCLAYTVIAPPALPEALAGRIMSTLSHATGAEGMVLGQMQDILAENQPITATELATIHANKTGQLIAAAIKIGAQCAGSDDAMCAQLHQIGQHLGLAFQIQDDLLDITGNTATLGKLAHADAKLNKATYPRLLGQAAAQAELDALHQTIFTALADLKIQHSPLAHYLTILTKRQH